MIKKTLFSLFVALLICITFVSTKVSADSINDLTPIYADQLVSYGTKLYYSEPTTETYDFLVSDAITPGILYTYSIYAYEGEWEVTIYGADGLEITIFYFTSDYFVLESIDTGPIVSGNFLCTNYTDADGLGYIGIISETSTESNVIYSGIFELLADTLYGGTENLSQTQIGLIEWFSIFITISCLLLPFIIVFFVIKLLFK